MVQRPYFLNNLIPRREKKEVNPDAKPLYKVLASITALQYLQFFSGWLCWTCDAIDFFCVSLSVTNLVKEFPGKQPSDVTTAITLTLLLRTPGAIVFGILSDRYGRKYPLVANMLFIAILEIGVSFVKTFPQFLAVRALFGLGMGGIWGMAASTSLEAIPAEARGLGSGILQQGYAVGYLIAAVINLTLVPEVSQGWRALFWVAAGISFTAASLRLILPESQVFLRAKAEKELLKKSNPEMFRENKTKVFFRETGQMLKEHWLLCIYGVLLMTGFNFLSHGSQDLYPTYLEDTKGFSQRDATVATIISNCGAISGGVIAGLISQYIGRRLTIIIFVLLCAAFIPLWIIPTGFSQLSAGAFCVQFGVQGAWGVIPIMLSELSPPAFRATFPGVAYQLGNMVSSASAQIEATGGNNFRAVGPNGEDIPDYAKVQGILIGVVAAFVIFMALIGPEQHGREFEAEPVGVVAAVLHEKEIAEAHGQHATVADDADVEEKGRSEIKEGSAAHPTKEEV